MIRRDCEKKWSDAIKQFTSCYRMNPDLEHLHRSAARSEEGQVRGSGFPATARWSDSICWVDSDTLATETSEY
jgi:hypothetical protein